MDSNVAKASAVTVLAAGSGRGGARGRAQLPAARPAGQDRHRRRQLRNTSSSPTKYQEELRKFGVQFEVRRTTRDQGQGRQIALRPLEGRITLRALTDDNSGITAGFVKGGLVGSLQGRLATEKQKGRHAEYSKLRSVGPAVLRADLGLHARRPADRDPARPQGQAHPASARARAARGGIASQLLRANGITEKQTPPSSTRI